MLPTLPIVVALSFRMADTTATKAELMTADRQLREAVSERGQGALIALLDSDAAVLMPGQPILRGREEAAPAMRARYDSPSAYSWIPTHAVAGIDGNFGCTVGVSTFIEGADSTHTTYAGRYITCWSRGRGASWTELLSDRDGGHGEVNDA